MRKRRFATAVLSCALALGAAFLAAPAPALAAGTAMPETIDAKDLFRLYNPYSGEHFYTASYVEHDNLFIAGWLDEGTGWKGAPFR